MAEPAPFSNLQTPEQIALNRKLGQQLMMQGMSVDPVGHWTQGLARVLQAGVGRMNVADADQQQQQRSQALQQALQNSGVLKGLSPADTAVLGSSPDLMQSAYKAVLSKKIDPTQGLPNSVREFQYGQQNPQFMEYLKQKKGEEYNKNLVYGTDEQGNIVPMQAGTKGNLVASKLPPGVSLQRDPIKFDAGDRYILLDPTTRQPIGAIPKNIAGVEEQKVLGEDAGKVKVAAPKMIAAQESLERDHRIMRDEIDKTREIAARSPLATGVPALLSSKIPGTTGYQVARLLDTIKARAGFDVLGNMRASSPTGGALGAITERELAFLQSVQGSLEQVQSQEDLDRVLSRLAEFTESANDTRRRALEYDLKRAGVSPDLLNRQQMLSPFTRNAQDTTKTPDGGQREFVGMQVDSRPGIPVAPERTAAPPSPAPAPLPRQQRVPPPIPQAAIDDLARNPSPQMKKFFEDHFNLPEGEADAYLKGRR